MSNTCKNCNTYVARQYSKFKFSKNGKITSVFDVIISDNVSGILDDVICNNCLINYLEQVTTFNQKTILLKKIDSYFCGFITSTEITLKCNKEITKESIEKLIKHLKKIPFTNEENNDC